MQSAGRSIQPVAFVLNSTFPYYSGGRENWLSHIADGLTRDGIPVVVFCLHPTMRRKKHFSIDPNVDIRAAGATKMQRLLRSLFRGPLTLLRLRYESHLIKRELSRWLRTLPHKPTVVCLDTVFTFMAVRAYLKKVRFVCAAKGPHANVLASRFPKHSAWFSQVELECFDSALEIWANGEDTASDISFQGYQVETVGNGVDVPAAKAPRSTPLEFECWPNVCKIVSIGTLLDIKGVCEAIEAFAMLQESAFTSSRLFFVGKGNATKYAILAESLGVSNDVEFVGERKEVFAYMQHADVLLCLSGGSGLSMAALECLASGVPVIGWDSPVYQQMITDGVNGFLVSHDDIEALAIQIQRVLSLSEAERLCIGNQASSSVAKHDWNQVISKVKIRLAVIETKGH